MKKLLFVPTLLSAMLLCACQAVPPAVSPAANAYQVFFTTNPEALDAPAVASESFNPADSGSPVAELMARLLEGPVSAALSSPFPAGVTLLSSSLEGGTLRLDLSEQYGGLSGIDLTVADCCIALTLCQIEGVREVVVTVQGEPLPYRNRQILRGSDVVLPSGADDLAYVAVTVYFPLSDLSGLGKQHRDVLLSSSTPLHYALAAAALGRPASSNLQSLAPEGSRVLSASVLDGVCTVDLSGEFLSNPIAASPEGKLLLYGLVNTLGALDAVNAVQILIEGEPVPFLGGMPALSPLAPDLSLVRGD